MQTIIEFENVLKAYNGKVLVDNVSFALQHGEITTLMGQNGAGKTTIAKIILGLEKATKGKTWVKPNLKIGYVPQKLGINANLPLVAGDLFNILAPHGGRGEVLDEISFIDFPKLKDKKVSDLSGGELQKVILYGTLANEPELVILDEPVQYLDVASQQEFYKTLVRLRKKILLSVFMISHDLFTVMKNSDQVICINGHVCCIGKPNDLGSNSELQNALTEIGLYIHAHNHDHNH